MDTASGSIESGAVVVMPVLLGSSVPTSSTITSPAVMNQTTRSSPKPRSGPGELGAGPNPGACRRRPLTWLERRCSPHGEAVGAAERTGIGNAKWRPVSVFRGSAGPRPPTVGVMAAFGELVGRFDADSGRRREQFAGLCRWFLTHAPVYAHQLRRVWLWKDWPGRYVGETGIDLVAEDRRGHLWAITATPCDAAAWITQRDAQAFLAAAGRAPFAFGLLIATTDLIGRTAQHTIETARKPAGLVLLGDLDAADLDWPVSPQWCVPGDGPHTDPGLINATRSARW